MKKRLFSILLSLVMVVGLLPATALASNELSFQMSGYTIGGKLSDVTITADNTWYTCEQGFFFAEMPADGKTFDLRKAAPKTTEITADAAALSYLVIPVKAAKGEFFSGKETAKLNGTLSGIFIKEAKFKISDRVNGSSSLPSVSASVVVFQAKPVQKHTVTIVNAADNTVGAGNYAPGETVYIESGYGDNLYFGGWQSDDVTVRHPGSPETYFTMPAKPVALKIRWLQGVTAVDLTLDASTYAVGEKVTDLKVSTQTDIVTQLEGYGIDYRISKNEGGSEQVPTGSTETFAADTDYYLWVSLHAVDGYLLASPARENIRLDGEGAVSGGGYFFIFKLPKLSEAPPAPTPTPTPTTYAVTVNGSEAASTGAGSYAEGDTVTIKAGTKDGYTFKNWTTADGVTFANADRATTTFVMPGKPVTVAAVFEKDAEPIVPVEPVVPVEPENPFVDVPSNAYFADAVLWAADKGITGGVNATHFAPDLTCTRAQAVTFLWRAAGCPAPKSTEMPFSDVAAGSYFYDAVLWAVENDITKGTSATKFSPDLECSRAQIVTFLWRSQNSPAVTASNPFADVKADAYYEDAVLWAVQQDITKGTSATKFSPDAECTRAQIVTFIYRCMK